MNCLGEVNWNGLVICPTTFGLEVGFEVDGEETEEGAEGCLKCSWWGLRGDSVGAGPMGWVGMKPDERARTRLLLAFVFVMVLVWGVVLTVTV